MSRYSFHLLAAYRTNCIFPYKFYSARVNHLIKRAVCVLNFNVCTETFGHKCHKTAYAERIQADTEAHAASSPPNQKTPSSFFSFLFFSFPHLQDFCCTFPRSVWACFLRVRKAVTQFCFLKVTACAFSQTI